MDNLSLLEQQQHHERRRGSLSPPTKRRQGKKGYGLLQGGDDMAGSPKGARQGVVGGERHRLPNSPRLTRTRCYHHCCLLFVLLVQRGQKDAGTQPW
jgi:hypothetical protein